jgi:hypothetical protein
MKVWQAHTALAQMIGDPITVSGSPVTLIPDGVRYSKKLRDLYLYRAMLNILDSIVGQTLQLPEQQAIETIQRYIPNYIVQDSIELGDLATDFTFDLSRRPVMMLGVYNDAGVHFRSETLNRFYAKMNHPWHEAQTDPRYTLFTPAALTTGQSYQNGRLRFDFSGDFYNKWEATEIHAVYIPTPLDPNTQSAEDPLDFEVLLADKVITIANTFAKADSQEGQ